MSTIAVIGAGNVGLAISGHMVLNGHEVRLYDRWDEPLDAVRANGGVDLIGEVQGRGTPAVLTTAMDQAVTGADLIVITAPAFAHEYIGEELVVHARPEQLVLFQPGCLGSGVNLLQQFARAQRPPCHVVETSTSLYTCRKRSATTVYIGAIKNMVKAAAIPHAQTAQCVDALNGYFDDRYVPGQNALTVGLDNANPIYHVPPAVLNFKTVEDSDQHPLHSLVTPRIAELIDIMDQERLALATALGVRSVSFWDFLASSYGVTTGDFHSRIVQGYGRQGFPEPDSVEHRYFTEDIPYGMVTWSSLAREVDLELPVTDALTTLASHLCGQNFATNGRTAATLGLEGAGRDGIRALFLDGQTTQL